MISNASEQASVEQLIRTNDLKPGSIIRSNSCSGGDIVITAPKGSIDVNGTVESVGSISGTGAVQAPGGGTITIKAFCVLAPWRLCVEAFRGVFRF